jgi:uncharacterized membrane protein
MTKNTFSKEEQQRIVDAIRHAELATSGEIRLHIEPGTSLNPVERAKEVFEQLGMGNTELKNGVLFYLAIEDRKLAIIGDSGIHQKVGDNFWQEEKELMVNHFLKGDYTTGICKAIEQVGEKLKLHFPFQQTDTNELSNDISFGG